MEKPKRVQLILLIVVITVGIIFATAYSQKTDYKVLFSNLEEADSGIIVDDLEANGIPYELENNGTTILIDEGEVDTYRIQLAADGLMPANSTGFEIFDSSSMMSTDEDRQIMYQRAISGELERAISSIAEVNSAKILLSIPEESVFQNPEYQKEASASIVLELQTSRVPSSETIHGIGSLVSGAVENLPIANVQIVDTGGNLLSRVLNDANDPYGSDVVSSQHQIKRSIEQDLEGKVIQLLAPVYGLDKVNISVNANLNFDAVEREVVAYENLEESEDPAIRSQMERVTGSQALAGQVQGGNLDDGTGAVIEGEEGADDNSTYEHTTNYELDQTIERIVEAPGAIEQMTASVIILDNQNNEEAIRNLVQNTLGIEANDLELEFMQVGGADEATPVLPDINLFEDIMETFSEYWMYIIGGLGFLILLGLIRRNIRKRREAAYYEDEEEFIEETEDSLAYQEAMDKLNDLSKQEETIEDLEKKAANEKAAANEQEVREQAQENPALAAELVKLWMKED